MLQHKAADGLLEHVHNLFMFLFPLFEQERRRSLTVAIGCTGGRHRSVVIALKLRQGFLSLRYDAHIRHRDMHRI